MNNQAAFALWICECLLLIALLISFLSAESCSPCVIFYSLILPVAYVLPSSGDLSLLSCLGRFAPSPPVVIFFSFGVSVASLFRGMRDLSLFGRLGRFAPSPPVVIFCT